MPLKVSMKDRRDSVMAENPQSQTSPTPPRCPATPETPTCDRKASSPLLSPFSTPLKTIRKTKNRTPKHRINTDLPPGLRPGNSPDIYAGLPHGFRPHLPLPENSQRKRALLNMAALSTRSERDKFRRIVEWDGTWRSTLALPNVEHYSDVQYFEDIFTETYPRVGQFARIHKFWMNTLELEYGLRVDSLEAVDPGPLPAPGALFDFASYYGNAEESENQIRAKKQHGKSSSVS